MKMEHGLFTNISTHHRIFGNRSKDPDKNPAGQKLPRQKPPDNKPPRIIEEIIAK